MTTRDFIAKTIGIPSLKERHCSSVYADHAGTVYSYGYHYPLAAIVNGIGYVNNRGYSTTTGKHIGWAFSALIRKGVEVHGVPLIPGRGLTPGGIRESATVELERLKKLADSKKRKDTFVYEDIQNQISNMEAVIKTV